MMDSVHSTGTFGGNYNGMWSPSTAATTATDKAVRRALSAALTGAEPPENETDFSSLSAEELGSTAVEGAALIGLNMDAGGNVVQVLRGQALILGVRWQLKVDGAGPEALAEFDAAVTTVAIQLALRAAGSTSFDRAALVQSRSALQSGDLPAFNIATLRTHEPALARVIDMAIANDGENRVTGGRLRLDNIDDLSKTLVGVAERLAKGIIQNDAQAIWDAQEEFGSIRAVIIRRGSASEDEITKVEEAFSALTRASLQQQVTADGSEAEIAAVTKAVAQGKTDLKTALLRATTNNDDLLAVQLDVAAEVATESGWRRLVHALTGTCLRDSPSALQEALAQLREAILNVDISPTVEIVPQGTLTSGDERTILPYGVNGAYVPGRGSEPGRILLAKGLTPEERLETLAEEYGEAMAEAAKGLGIRPAVGDAGERLKMAVGGKDVRPDNPETRGLFTDAPDDSTVVQVDGRRMTVEADAAPALDVNANDRMLSHLFAADGYFNDSSPNGRLSAGELEVAFSNGILGFTGHQSIVAPFTGPGINPLSDQDKADIAALVNTFGSVNPDTGYMTLGREELTHLIKEGYIGLGSSAGSGVLDVLKTPAPGAKLNTGLTLQEAFQVAVAEMTPAQVKEIVGEFGVMGLMAYVAQALGLTISTQEIRRIAEVFAHGQAPEVLGKNATTILHISAMAFSAVMLGNKGYRQGLDVFRTAVRSELGLEDSSHGVSQKWQEYLFIGDRNGATPGSEFLRSYLSVGREAAAKRNPALVSALDGGTHLPGAQFYAPAQVPTYYKGYGVRRSTATEDPFDQNGNISGSAFNFEHLTIVNATTRNTDPDSEFHQWLELPSDMGTHLQAGMGLKAVLVSTRKRNGYQGEMLIKVDYRTSGPKADEIRKHLSNGYRMEYVEVAGANEALKTTAELSPYLSAEASDYQYEYNADGTLRQASVTTRMAQYYQDTEFAVYEEHSDGDLSMTGPTRSYAYVEEDYNELNDQEAIRGMLNDLGITDAQIDDFLIAAEAQAANLDIFAEKAPSALDIVTDIAGDLFTYGISTIIKEFLPNERHPITDFAIEKLTGQGRSTGQADKLAKQNEGIDFDSAVIVEGIAFLLLDLAGFAGVTKIAKATKKAVSTGVSFKHALATTADATTDTATGSSNGRALGRTSSSSDTPGPTRTSNPEIEPAPPRTGDPLIGPNPEQALIDNILSTPLQSGPHKGAMPVEILKRAEAANWMVNPTDLSFDQAEEAGKLIHIAEASDSYRAKFISVLEESGQNVDNGWFPDQEFFSRPQLKGGGNCVSCGGASDIAEPAPKSYTRYSKKLREVYDEFAADDLETPRSGGLQPDPLYARAGSEARIQRIENSITENIDIIRTFLKDIKNAPLDHRALTEARNEINKILYKLGESLAEIRGRGLIPADLMHQVRRLMVDLEVINMFTDLRTAVKKGGIEDAYISVMSVLSKENPTLDFNLYGKNYPGWSQANDDLVRDVFNTEIDGVSVKNHAINGTYYFNIAEAGGADKESLEKLANVVKNKLGLNNTHELFDKAPPMIADELKASINDNYSQFVIGKSDGGDTIDSAAHTISLEIDGKKSSRVSFNESVNGLADYGGSIFHEHIHARQHLYKDIYLVVRDYINDNMLDASFDEQIQFMEDTFGHLGIDFDAVVDVVSSLRLWDGEIRTNAPFYSETWHENEAWSVQLKFVEEIAASSQD